MPLLKILFWVYFFLFVFEGALRKWALPQFSGPLTLVRDPVALLIVWEAYRTRKWPLRWSATIGALTAGMLLLAFVQMVMAGTPWQVLAFGLQSYLLSFPVAFIMGENLDANDLRQFGVCIVLLLIPLTLIEVLQYYSPATSFWNRGASTGSVQLSYAGGHVRPSATFSYTVGPTGYVPLAAAFIIYGIVSKNFVPKWLLWTAGSALILAVPVSGSRSLLVTLIAIVACVAIAGLFGVEHMASLLKVGLAFGVVGLAISQLPVFSDAMNTFETRIASASGSEGGTEHSLLVRGIEPIVRGFDSGAESTDWFGEGIGNESNFAYAFAGGGAESRGPESEFERNLLEFGFAPGLAFVLFRTILVLALGVMSIIQTRNRRPLALFLYPVTALFAIGTLEQPTVQGLVVISLALSLSAIQTGKESSALSLARSSRQSS